MNELSALSTAPDLWNDPANAQKVLQELTTLKNQVELVERLENQESDLS
ncbi:MAG: peptide chain release factor 2, partial [Bacteroidota bacterium]